MGDPVGQNGVPKRRGYVLLARHFGECLGSPFSRDNLIAHEIFPAARGSEIWTIGRGSGLGWRRRPNEGTGGFRVPRRDRRASPLAAEFLLRLLPSGSDRVHRVPNSSGTLRSPLDTRETKVHPCRPRVNASLLNSPRVVRFGRLLATPRRASGSGGLLAERVGFEPTEGLHLHLISNQARSTGLRHLSRFVSP